MRSGRSFLILLVLAVGIGAYAYFVESKKDLTPPEQQHPKVFTTDSSKVDEIDVRSASGESTTLKKTGDTWQITSPVQADADESTVGTLVSTVTSLESQRTVDDHPASVAAYGLSPARFSVAFKATGDAALHRLNVGSKTPSGSDTYAQVEGQPKVFLISSYIEDSLNHGTFDLRDKTALKVSRDAIDALTLKHPTGPPIGLAKNGSDWRLIQPLDARADFGSVDAMLSRIADAKMKSLVAPGSRPPAPAKPSATPKPGETTPPATPPPAPETKPGPVPTSTDYSAADLKAYGLDTPQLVVTVGAGSTQASLAIGGKYDDQSLYAKDLSRPLVFTIDKGVLDDLNKKVDDLRVKDVFEFRAYTATSIDLTYGGTTYSFVKQPAPPARPNESPAAPPADVWKETKPAAKDVDQTKITDLLTDLSNLRADSFADKALASGSDLVVTAHFGDASAPKDEHVTLRKSGTVVQAIHPGDTGGAVVQTPQFDKVIADLKGLGGK